MIRAQGGTESIAASNWVPTAQRAGLGLMSIQHGQVRAIALQNGDNLVFAS